MKWDFKIVVLLVEWSSFGVVLKRGFTVLNLPTNTCITAFIPF